MAVVPDGYCILVSKRQRGEQPQSVVLKDINNAPLHFTSKAAAAKWVTDLVGSYRHGRGPLAATFRREFSSQRQTGFGAHQSPRHSDVPNGKAFQLTAPFGRTRTTWATIAVRQNYKEVN